MLVRYLACARPLVLTTKIAIGIRTHYKNRETAAGTQLSPLSSRHHRLSSALAVFHDEQLSPQVPSTLRTIGKKKRIGSELGCDKSRAEEADASDHVFTPRPRRPKHGTRLVTRLPYASLNKLFRLAYIFPHLKMMIKASCYVASESFKI